MEAFHNFTAVSIPGGLHIFNGYMMETVAFVICEFFFNTTSIEPLVNILGFSEASLNKEFKLSVGLPV